MSNEGLKMEIKELQTKATESEKWAELYAREAQLKQEQLKIEEEKQALLGETETEVEEEPEPNTRTPFILVIIIFLLLLVILGFIFYVLK